MSDNFSQEFLSNLSDLVSAFEDATRAFHDKIDDCLEAEGKRLTETLTPPIAVGTRVFVSNYKSEGTVTKAWVSLSADNGDYYAPQTGVESLGPAVAIWMYEIQPDPTPKRKQVRPTVTTSRPEILGRLGYSYTRTVVAEQPEDED